MEVRELGAGDVLAGKYELLEPLGRGAMGAVWKANHRVLGSPVALKLIHSYVASSPTAHERFLREAQTAAAVRGPHVVQVLDYGVHEGTPFMVMELLEGESLGARLRRVGVLGAPELARVLTHCARALEKAHEQGLVHRDLKPDNIFIVQNADEEIIKVLDFGIAKVTSGDRATKTGAVLGTPHYISPEQAQAADDIDGRTDLWALGVISFLALTGRTPFAGEVVGDLLLNVCTAPIPVPSQVAQVPDGFDAWFARACDRDVSARFQTARALADAFRDQVAGAGVATAFGHTASSAPEPPIVPADAPPSVGESTASPVITSAVPAKRSSSSGLVVAIVAVVLVLGGVAAVALFLLLRGSQQVAETLQANPPTAVSAVKVESPPEEFAAPAKATPGSVTKRPSTASKPPGASPPGPTPGDPVPDPDSPAKTGVAGDLARAKEDIARAKADIARAKADVARAEKERKAAERERERELKAAQDELRKLGIQ